MNRRHTSDAIYQARERSQTARTIVARRLPCVACENRERRRPGSPATNPARMSPLRHWRMERPMSRQVPRKSPKVRATLYLPDDLLDEARDATVHLAGFPVRLTLTKFAEDAFRAELQRLKDRYNAGLDFPPRDEDLKGGRPIAA